MKKLEQTSQFLIAKFTKKPLAYLDNGATTLKPRQVVDAVQKHYEEECANIHRGIHWLSERATEVYESTREKVHKLIQAQIMWYLLVVQLQALIWLFNLMDVNTSMKVMK